MAQPQPSQYSLEDYMRVFWRELEAPIREHFVKEIYRITNHEPENARGKTIERVLEDVAAKQG